MILILFVTLLFILYINFRLHGKDYISPSFTFTASFVFATFWALMYWHKWDVFLNFKTLLFIVTGAIVFTVVSAYISKKTPKSNGNKIHLKEYKTNRKLEVLFVVVAIITFVLTALNIVSLVGSDIAHIRTALYTYRDLTTFRNVDLSLPFYINILTGVIHASGYWFIYIFLNNFFITKKIDKLKLLIIVICLLSTFLEGSRGMAVNYILFTFCALILNINIQHNFYNAIKKKTILIIGIVGIGLLLLFQQSAIFIGRDNVSAYSLSDYLALYSGAEIKNFDTFLLEDSEKLYYGKYTFSSMNNLACKYLDCSTTYDFSFRHVNGYDLGNVYTIFYHFYLDFGFLGIIILPALMALISQIVYERCKKNQIGENPNLSKIIYCYIYGGIILSFFSNNFFSLIFSSGFLKYLIVWYMLNLIFIKQNKSKNIN